MAARVPQSQTRMAMEQKREIARQLLAQGLTIKQIRLQLRCSETFLRQVRAEARQEGQEER